MSKPILIPTGFAVREQNPHRFIESENRIGVDINLDTVSRTWHVHAFQFIRPDLIVTKLPRFSYEHNVMTTVLLTYTSDFKPRAVEMSHRKSVKKQTESLASIAINVWRCYSQGRWLEGKILREQHMELCIEIFGEGHPNALISMSNLAHNLKALGRPDEALKLLRTCAALSSDILGSQNPCTEYRYRQIRSWNKGDAVKTERS